MELQRKHSNKIDFRSRSYSDNFKRVYPDVKMTQPLHTLILKIFFNIVVREIIHNMYKFHFPGLGYFYLAKNKKQVKIDAEGKIDLGTDINWPETIKVRNITGDKTKKVLFLNEHTNGYLYGLYWDKKNAAFINRRFYSFIPCRTVKRYLASVIFDNIKPLNAYIR